jgi:serine/threonine protein kinase
MASSSSNVVGVHYRVGKKIGEGSFGVIFEGTNLLNNQQVAIKFVSSLPPRVPIAFRANVRAGTEKERCTSIKGRVQDVQDPRWMPLVALPVSIRSDFLMLTRVFSRHPERLLLWPGGTAQHTGYRPARA